MTGKVVRIAPHVDHSSILPPSTFASVDRRVVDVTVALTIRRRSRLQRCRGDRDDRHKPVTQFLLHGLAHWLAPAGVPSHGGNFVTIATGSSRRPPASLSRSRRSSFKPAPTTRSSTASPCNTALSTRIFLIHSANFRDIVVHSFFHGDLAPPPPAPSGCGDDRGCDEQRGALATSRRRHRSSAGLRHRSTRHSLQQSGDQEREPLAGAAGQRLVGQAVITGLRRYRCLPGGVGALAQRKPTARSFIIEARLRSAFPSPPRAKP